MCVYMTSICRVKVVSGYYCNWRALEPSLRPRTLARCQQPRSDQSRNTTAKIARVAYQVHDFASLFLSSLDLQSQSYLLQTSAYPNMGESNPGAGHESAPVPVAWLKRDVLLFAASIGAKADELQYLYVSTKQSPDSFLLYRRRNSPAKFSDSACPGTPPQLRRLPYLSHHPPLQTHQPRSRRLLRRPTRFPPRHPRRPQTRQHPRPRWRAENDLLQAPPSYFRRPEIRSEE